KMIEYGPDQKFIAYMQHPSELWARSFDQYISLRSESLDMQQFLTFFRVEQQERPIHYPHVWSWQEFGPIADAMDKLFAAMGWLNLQTAVTDRRTLAEMDTKQYQGFDPIDHPRWPAGFERAGEFMEKPDNLSTPSLRLRWGQATMEDLLDVLDTKWRPKN